MKNYTITDIAKILGISSSTVSRALNNHPDISPETKKRVKETAKKVNFTPNLIAQNLKNNKSTTIGIIVPEIKHDFFSSAISGIEEVANQNGFTILLCQSNESYEKEVINLKVLVNHRVAGIIASITENTVDSSHFQNVLNRKTPLVFFDRVCEDIKASKIIINDKASAKEVVNHLIKKGYKRIAHFTGPSNLSISNKRLEGYKEALEQACIKIQEELIIPSGFHEQNGYIAMEKLLDLKIKADSIFAVNDPCAIGAFQKIKELGLKIPEDYAIVGFSNNKITELLDPSITTLNQPSYEMGRKAAEILIEEIKSKSKKIEPRTIVMKTELIIRNST